MGSIRNLDETNKVADTSNQDAFEAIIPNQNPGSIKIQILVRILFLICRLSG